MNRIKDIVAAIAWVALVGLTSVGVGVAFHNGLAGSVATDRTEFLRAVAGVVWSALDDGGQRAIIDRFEREFTRDVDWSGALAELSREERLELEAKFDSITVAWFLARLDEIDWESPDHREFSAAALLNWRLLQGEPGARTFQKPDMQRPESLAANVAVRQLLVGASPELRQRVLEFAMNLRRLIQPGGRERPPPRRDEPSRDRAP